MDNGKLRDRIIIQQRSGTGDSRTWATFLTCWAQVDPLAGNRYMPTQNGLVLFDVTHTAKIRYYPGISSEMRIIWDHKVLQITSIVDDPFKKWTTIQAVQSVEETT